AGGNPGAEADRTADLGPALAEADEYLLGLRTIGADQHQEAFVTADPENKVVLAHAPAQRVGEVHEDLVAGLVAVAVVVVLEVIQVDEYDSRRACVHRQLGPERAPVEQLGEGVGDGDL